MRTRPVVLSMVAGLLAVLGLAPGCGPEATSPPRPSTAARSPAPSASASLGTPSTGSANAYRVEEATTLKTSGGATFPVAAGWFVTQASDRILLEDPERQLKIVCFEVQGESAGDAIAEAWAKHDSKFALKATRSDSPPSRDWDEVVQIVYNAPEPSRLVLGNARRRGKVSWVMLLDAPQGAVDRRGAQLQNTFDGLQAPGQVRESWAGQRPRVLDEAKKAALLEFAERARVALHVPGAAFAVVQDGRVVAEAGLGVRELGKSDRVTPSTLFLIGSTTKSLSTLLLARAVDEGKFTWETKVRAVDPNFTLADEALSARLEVQHLVCACTGIPRYDLELLFTFAGVRPEHLMSQLKLLKPTTAFGETFQYNNQLVASAGFLAAAAFYPKLPLGEAYDRAMREKVLVPLGMTDSTFSLKQGRARAASTHGEDAKGEVRVMPFAYEDFVIPLRPSGGLLSNVRDMTKYLLAEMAQGKSVTGVQVASPANVLRRRKPQVKLSDDVGYGMGLLSGTHKGLAFVEHGGATFGHRSTFMYLPELGIGITLLANGPGPLGSMVKAKLVELLFDSPPQAERLLSHTVAESKKSVDLFQEQLAPPSEGKDVVAALVGRYRNDRLGDVTLSEQGGELWLDAGEWKSRVAWQKRTGAPSALVLVDAPVAGVAFERKDHNGKPALLLAFQQHEYRFVK